MSKIYSELTTKRALEDIIQSLGNCLLMTSSSRRSNQWKLWSSTEFVVQILADIGAQSSLSSLYDLHGIFELYLVEKRINQLSKFVTIEKADGFESKLPKRWFRKTRTRRRRRKGEKEKSRKDETFTHYKYNYALLSRA